ncbi:MAG: DUF3016 domain-containing protein [Candidatus Rokuibacteriota bacterium]|jgi:hypothetical protein
MKIVPTSLAVLALSLAVGAAAAQDSRVSVAFAHPDRYADLRLTSVSGDADARALMSELARFLQEAGARRVPEGQRLEITVTDIDMAGDIESWRGPGRCDLRIRKDVYPPRIDLQFRLLGADGAEARAGTRRLRDSNYLINAAPVAADHLRHEKALLLDWLQKELREAAGS